LTGLLNDDAPIVHAAFYDSGSWTVFGPDGSGALGINDAGQVVGFMPAFGGPIRNHAFLYADGALTDLNRLIPSGSGILLESAAAINNAGQIVGSGWSADGRSRHGFLLTPDDGGAPHGLDRTIFRLLAPIPRAVNSAESKSQSLASALRERTPGETVAPLDAAAGVRQATDAVFAHAHRTSPLAQDSPWEVGGVELELFSALSL
jgi:probable HAF family extracellular repeat protein